MAYYSPKFGVIHTPYSIAAYMKPFVLLSVFYVALQAQAQQYNPEKIAPKIARIYSQGLAQAQDGNIPAGIALMHEAIAKDNRFMDAWLSLAGMHGELGRYDSAVYYYEKARPIDSIYFRDYSLPYSIDLAGIGEFEKALQAVASFTAIPNLSESSLKSAAYRARCYQFAIDYKKSHPDSGYVFNPVNLGDSINSPVSEYFPAFTIDSKRLIFTRRVRGINEDFFETVRNNQQWSLAQPLAGNINTNANEGAQNISQDGQWLIFTGCNFPEGYGSCDLYISYLTPDGWSAPENMGNRINTDQWETAPSLSPDKQDLYFTSKRFGGYGGSDIYVSHRRPNGQWSEPENLGPEINTIGDESCPFIHADNQTLYFTSSGLPGYGGDDLFVTHKLADGKWSTPLNLGYPINTIDNEGSMVVTADGTTAYYASNRSDSRGGLDLYSFELRKDIRPIKTLWVEGRVYDKKTGKGLPSAVLLTDLATKEVISKVQTDETGHYLTTLPTGHDYAFNVNRRGYLFSSDHFLLKEKTADSVYHTDIALQPVEANASIVLNNIFFDVNKFELKTESQVDLDQVISFLKENPAVIIQISGHTDNSGKAADNLTLSANRAKSVVNYLLAHGIAPARLKYQGYGDKVPVAPNTTEQGKAQNRRTELKIVSM